MALTSSVPLLFRISPKSRERVCNFDRPSCNFNLSRSVRNVLHTIKPERRRRREQILVCARSADIEVEGATKKYCDDFVCESSPAVETTVRSLANDIEKLRWTLRLFQPDVEYSDKFRSFKGVEKYTRMTFVKDRVEKPRVEVTRMRMMKNSVSVIDWQMRGAIAGQPVEVDFSDEFEHNQLTGRIVSHKETWQVRRGLIPFNSARAAWSAAQAQSDVSDLISRSVDELRGPEDDGYYSNPADPGRFFQKPDDGTQDMIQYALVVAFLYLIYQAFSFAFRM